MTILSKVYGFRLPFDEKLYNIGNRYTILQKYKKDKTSGYKIILHEKKISKHDKLGEVEMTKKSMHLHSKIPFMVRKLIPDEACVLTETSWYTDEQIITTYRNNHFSEETFYITVETFVGKENPFKDIEVEYVDLSEEKSEFVCFKKLEINVNNYFLGWIANEIDKSLKQEMLTHHKLIIETKDEWIEKTNKELDQLEREFYDKI